MRGIHLYRALLFVGVIGVFYWMTSHDNSEKVEYEVLSDYDQVANTDGSILSIKSTASSLPSTTTVPARKRILIWNIPSSVTYPRNIDERCGLCDVTTNRTLLSDSDAVVFHFRKIAELPDPALRKPQQLFVWLCRESPSTTKLLTNLNLDRYDHYFNATMTHRRESEIFSPYLRPLTYDTSPYLHVRQSDILKTKRQLAAWVVSNCGSSNTATRRRLFVSSLAEAGLKVDLFGKCYNKEFPPYKSKEALEKLSEYKFYLAMENSYHCRDYVTEKFWNNAILSGAVPIVWGPEKDDILQIAPPKSFIFAEDFDSPRKLVEYINFLDTHDDEYLKFFDWRNNLPEDGGFLYRDQAARVSVLHKPKIQPTNWMLEGVQEYEYCELCRTLHSNRVKSYKTVPSLKEFWYDHERKECLVM